MSEPLTILKPDSLEQARRVFEIEAEAIRALTEKLDESFSSACQKVLKCSGRVVVTGMGKSGHIAGKIAATLASTGTPSFFVHPGEASHGDLGMITPDDILLALSNSGETPELLTILPIVKRLGCTLITLTGKPGSTLAVQADISLDCGVEREACLHNLAPTSSTTASLVMGDALAVSVQQLRGFSAQDFAKTHPGGTLGRRLLLYASDLMHHGDALPVVGANADFRELILEMSSKSLGMAGVIDDQGRLLGMFTDGDLRRCLETETDVYASKALDVVTREPFTIQPDMLAAEVVKIMRDFAQHGPHAVNCVFVVDSEQKVVGALNTHDLLKAGVI
ncbi:MAG: KpsF/GutQ family sugar-phosphate isomerase [Pseudomonadota bacterium]